jgi:hypothetical protein
VDERIDRLALFVAAEKAVIVGKGVSEVDKGAAQVVGSVLVVMEMDLDLAHAGATDLRELIQMFTTVLFGRIEESVLNRSTIRILE